MKFILLLFILSISNYSDAQSFYGVTSDNGNFSSIYYQQNKYQLTVGNCADTIKQFACPAPETAFFDIATDQQGNTYYCANNGKLFRSVAGNNSFCDFLGTFPASANALVCDANGDVYAVAGTQSVSTLYKYTVSSNTITSLGAFNSNIHSSGDLFFYRGKLFLYAYNPTGSFILEISLGNLSQSCIYMTLNGNQGYGGFTVDYAEGTHVYMLAPTNSIGARSVLFEINMITKTMSAPICYYPQAFQGAASVYTFSPSIVDSSANCFVLPIQLTKFYYELKNNAVQLHWNTETEINSSHFIVERSFDGKSYSSIGKVNAAVNSNTIRSYALTDKNPSLINYYRLKETDLDGKFTYSRVLVVKLKEQQVFLITENPAKDFLRVQINLQQSQLRTLSIFDHTGRLLKQSNAFSGIQNIDISSLPPATYVLQLITADGKRYQQVFVVR